MHLECMNLTFVWVSHSMHGTWELWTCMLWSFFRMWRAWKVNFTVKILYNQSNMANLKIHPCLQTKLMFAIYWSWFHDMSLHFESVCSCCMYLYQLSSTSLQHWSHLFEAFPIEAFLSESLRLHQALVDCEVIGKTVTVYVSQMRTVNSPWQWNVTVTRPRFWRGDTRAISAETSKRRKFKEKPNTKLNIVILL